VRKSPERGSVTRRIAAFDGMGKFERAVLGHMAAAHRAALRKLRVVALINFFPLKNMFIFVNYRSLLLISVIFFGFDFFYGRIKPD
jgi:hypothetical protein